jgi:hypothetical protein
MRPLLAVLLPALLLLSGCSATATDNAAGSGSITVPDVVGQTGDKAQDALEEAGLKPDFDGGSQVVILKSNWTVDSTNPAAGIKVNSDSKVTVKVHKTEKAAASAESDEPSSAPTKAAPAKKVLKSFSGSGDDVLKVDYEKPVIISFSCKGCSSNTVVKTDSGMDTLLVNTIGGYHGRHIVNTQDSSVLSKITINADAHWALQIQNPAAAITKRIDRTGDSVSGSGDDVIYVADGIGDAEIRNHGEGNFVVEAYGENVGFDGLAVNEIGSYHGTVPLAGPAFVQIQSDGTWTVKGKD